MNRRVMKIWSSRLLDVTAVVVIGYVIWSWLS